MFWLLFLTRFLLGLIMGKLNGIFSPPGKFYQELTAQISGKIWHLFTKSRHSISSDCYDLSDFMLSFFSKFSNFNQ